MTGSACIREVNVHRRVSPVGGILVCAFGCPRAHPARGCVGLDFRAPSDGTCRSFGCRLRNRVGHPARPDTIDAIETEIAHLDAAAAMATSLDTPHDVRGRRCRLPVAAAERSPLMPNVPTLGQDGMKQFDVENFYAVYVPKNTPPSVVSKLEREIRKILTNPDFKARMATQGIHPQFANSEQLAEITNKEHDKWEKVVKSANVKVD